MSEEQDFPDVTLVAENNKQIEAHRVVLAAMAPLGEERRFLMNKVLGIYHYHWMQTTKPDIVNMIMKKFSFEEIGQARHMLGGFFEKESLPKDWPKTRNSSEKYLKDIQGVFSLNDFEGQEINVFVSSADLKDLSMMVNCPGAAVDPREVVPVSTRLG